MGKDKEVQKVINRAYYYAIANYLFNKNKIDAATLQRMKKKIATSN